MKINRCLLSVAVAGAICLLGTGCRTFIIKSNPPGAKILFNDSDSGKVTPFEFSPRHFVIAEYKVTVEKEGYLTDTPAQTLVVEKSGGEIVWSIILPPVFLKNIIHNNWKSTTGDLSTFQLKQETGPSDFSRKEKAKLGRDSIPARLELLKKMKEQGLVSEEEYDQKRKVLLDEL